MWDNELEKKLLSIDITDEDYQLFFGKTRSEIFEHSDKISQGNGNFLKQQAFYRMIKKSPVITESSVREMYMDEDLCAIHLSAFAPGYFRGCVNQLKQAINDNHLCVKMGMDVLSAKENASVLDFGTGGFHHSMWMKLLGFKKVEVADIPHRVFQFARYLFNKHGIQFVYREINKEIPDLEHVDYIINSEVMEHVFAPEKVMRLLSNKINPGGWMYLSTFFDSCYMDDPTHLSWNEKYQDNDLWFGVVESLGLSKEKQDNNGCWKGWRKVR